MKWIILSGMMIAAAFSASATYTDGYYDRLDGKKKEALKAAAKECVKNHTRLEYYELPSYWQYSDVYPELVDGCKRWWEMYSDAVYLIQKNQTAKSSFSANRMQREHSVPKSWWKSGGDVEYTPCYTDMWNLYPSDGTANGAKSNYPLGIVAETMFDNGVTKVGVPASGYGGGAGQVFEPADEYKGDFARGFFYVATVYDDLPWSTYYGWMYAKNSWPTLKPWAYEMLLQWCRQDPVSQKEIMRNDAVENMQGNRNPFVDFPELAEYIWGTRTLEIFRVEDQENVSPTIPITGDPEITLPVNDETLSFEATPIGSTSKSWLVIHGRNLTAPLSLRIAGEHKDMYTLPQRTINASEVNATGEYLLPIEYTPTSLGQHTASLSIYDGGLEGSIRVILQGNGVDGSAVEVIEAEDADYALCAPVDGGFRFLNYGSDAPVEVVVYDVQGSKIISTHLNHGDLLPLSKGIYIVTSYSFKNPFKLIVE